MMEAVLSTSTTFTATAAAMPTPLELLPDSESAVLLALSASVCALGRSRPLPPLFVRGLSLT